MPSLAIWQFFAAGAVCALGPVVIHLLNRRRYRTVSWAAMDFLREALQRNRRLLQLRDLLLLLLRMAALVLFGLALAQPSCSQLDVAGSGTEPLHAVVLIDNSLSMGYREHAESLLDQAKRRAAEFLTQLPAGSRVSVIPLAGLGTGYSRDAYATLAQAQQAIERVETVDRGVRLIEAANLAKVACESGPRLAKRIVLFTDQQRRLWEESAGLKFDDLPAPLQVVEVAPAAPAENAWIAELRLDDGVADVETPARLVAVVRYEGTTKRENCKVTLEVAGQPAGEQTLDLAPGATHDLVFKYEFREARPEPGQPVFVPVTVSLAPDRLPADDSAHLMAPVVAGLPVVFIDQYRDDQEDVSRGRRGETRMLRRLLAPRIRGEDDALQLIKVRHVTPDDLAGPEGRQLLADARLAVMAGVADPGPAVEVLREFVQQGGQLFLAAGGDFDIGAWNETAWNGGQGILPAPLLPELLGGLPDATSDKLVTFQLANDSLLQSQALFHVADLDPVARGELVAEVIFYQSAKVDLSPATAEKAASEAVRLALEQEEFLEQAAERRRQWQAREGKLSEAELAQRRDDEERLRRITPTWLTWKPAGNDAAALPAAGTPDRKQAIAEKAAAGTHCRVLARYNSSGGEPFLVERNLGLGRVMFCSTGLLPEWNELARTNAVLLFDRLLRERIEATLPRRNFPVVDRIPLPIAPSDRQVALALARPGDAAGEGAPLDVGFIGSDQVGVVVEAPFRRGIYRIREALAPPAAAATGTAREPLTGSRQYDLAVQGDGQESDLRSFSRQEFDARGPVKNLAWIGSGTAIGLEGAVLQSRNLWRWLVAVVLALLLVELLALAWPVWRSEQAPAPAT